jgi:Zn-dependent protease with chaperone function
MSRRQRAYLARRVASREEAHRRALLLGIGALTLLSTTPVFGHHLARSGEMLLSGTDRIGEICLVALHIVLAPVHEFFHLLLLAGLVWAIWDRVRAWRQMQRVIAPLEVARPAAGDAFWTAAREAGLDPALLRVVDGLPNPAFTAGWLRPCVFVARELAERLSPAELAAVIAHERAHVARRDPLRLSVLRFFGYTLFWIPAFARLADDIADEAEVEADDRAAGDKPLVLASAILAVAQWMPREARLAAAVGFTRHDMLERRVRRLAGEVTMVRTNVTRRSIAGAGSALALVWISGLLMAHPLEAHSAPHRDGSIPADCAHHAGPAILHIFCPGLSLGSTHHPCPHFASMRM